MIPTVFGLQGARRYNARFRGSVLFRSLALAAALLLPGHAVAQWLPEGPVQTRDGRLTLGGEVVATAGPSDTEAFFNYTDYEHNALRLFRLSLAGAWRPGRRLAFVGELRSDGLDQVHASAAYVRVRPWVEREFDIQAGRIPPVFGAFARRVYAQGNPLIGYPLAYQYLTSLRADAAPVTADDLLRMRGRGWRSSFPAGSPDAGPGLPLVSAFRWDTGVQARWGHGPFEASAALTNGSLSNPRVRDDNAGKQVSVRAALTPAPGLVVGASAARGAWVDAGVPRDREGPLAQTAAGLDVEYAWDRWIVRAEAVFSRWDLPYSAATANGRDVRAAGAWLEARYRLAPRVFVAARADRLTFSRVPGGAFGTGPIPWEAPVRRLEWTAGYYLQRNVVGRVGVQANWRDVGRIRQRTYAAAQVGWWF
jgi:hypothetical protein